MSLRKILAATGGALLLFHMALTAGGYDTPAHWLKARLTDPQRVKLSMALELNGFRSAPLLSTPGADCFLPRAHVCPHSNANRRAPPGNSAHQCHRRFDY